MATCAMIAPPRKLSILEQRVTSATIKRADTDPELEEMYFDLPEYTSDLQSIKPTRYSTKKAVYKTPKCTSWAALLYYTQAIEYLEIVDFGNNALITSARNFTSATSNLTTIKLPKNVFKYKANDQGFRMDGVAEGKLTDDSLVSVGNSLYEGVAATDAYYVQFLASDTIRLSTIMGTVALDPTETFHIFTKDASGTVSLASFITDTKHWGINAPIS